MIIRMYPTDGLKGQQRFNLNYSWKFSYMLLTLSFSHEYPRISINYPLMAARSPFCLTNTDDTDQTDNKESGQSEQSVFKIYKDFI